MNHFANNVFRRATRAKVNTAQIARYASTRSTYAGFQAGSANKWLLAAGSVAFAGAWALSSAINEPVKAESAPLAGVQGTSSERTFIAVKPDGVQRGLVGEIIGRFEKRGYKLVAMKVVVPSKELAEEHYADLKTKPFFGGLVEYMTNGAAPVVAMVWEGKDVIKQGRSMIGATNPLVASPGSIRGDLCISVGRNIIHGSDSYDSASKEIGLWFGKPGEIVNWTPAIWGWTHSEN